MQICKVLDSFSPKCSSARNVERCSQARGYPRKIFSDNLINIDTNSKKCQKILWCPGDHHTQIFRDPCFGSFSDEAPEITIIKPIMETRDHNLYQNTPYTILQPYPKLRTLSFMLISHTDRPIYQHHNKRAMCQSWNKFLRNR